MNEPKPIFYDPKGARKRWAGLVAWVLGTVSAALSAYFFYTLITVSAGHGPVKIRLPKPLTTTLDMAMRRKDLKDSRAALAQSIAATKAKKHVKPGPAGNYAVAFYAPWETSGLASLRANANKLTHLVPAWLHLTPDGKSIDFRDFSFTANPSNRDAIQIARDHGVEIIPMLDNSEEEQFDPKRAKALLESVADRTKLIGQIEEWLVTNHFQGLNVDFEELPAGTSEAYLAFLKELRAALRPANLSVSVDLQSGDDETDLASLSDDVDWAVLMAYDQHSEATDPGPISAIPWTEKQLDRVLTKFPEDKLVLGVGAYSYDWTNGAKGAESISFSEAMARASDNIDDPARDAIDFDSESLNAHFAYEGEDHKDHTVWMLDAVSAYDQWKLGQDAGVKGAAVWVLGIEDPSLWTFFDRNKLANPPAPSALSTIRFPYEISFEGKGEIISVSEQPQLGKRSTKSDPETGLIEEASYLDYAFPYMIQKGGYKPNKLVLTFDDGPDPEYTPAILDELKDLQCPGTFFVIGQSAEHNPGLVKRIVKEGHEIGSHTYSHPNIGAVSTARADLELNATQRAIQCLTEKSTRLFRPPYNADSMPETLEQVTPVVIASKLGYITVGENVDPHDWDTTVHLKDGSTRAKTGEDIALAVMEDLKSRRGTENEGNIILLHDAGGDRHATVDALHILVPQLRAQGYQFVTVADLLGKKESDLMPPISNRDRAVIGIDRTVFTVAYGLEAFLAGAFVFAIVIGLTRSLFIGGLALFSIRRGAVPLVGPVPTVSVVIAAYNEEKVIAKTVRSVLMADSPVQEVIVVDDGSTDGTLQVLRETFGDNPKIVTLTKENGGKASALNLAVARSKGDLLFAIDADTVVHPSAIGILARRFADPKVGAVAGNVEVGNVNNLLTLWQSIEYTTSQNLDRRAYALLNAITVVPGAIGMWRKSAVSEVGGYSSDTLAEDMDLTWRLRRAGYRLETEPSAKAFTEAPQGFRAFFRQRSRWAFGTLQCLWKHRDAVGRYGWFGRFALPILWLFQIVFQALAPLIDLQVMYSALSLAYVFMTTSAGSVEVETRQLALEDFNRVLILYAMFFVVEFIASAIAYRLEKRPIRTLWWLFLQRFVYRQIMYGVIYQSLVRALTGHRQGWGKLARTGTVAPDGN